ncbi:DUF4407 domain-containing protein [Nocardia yunnanensis]|nr:DUF4407 domain-containing protein [Nocardia yunnanensis]
MGADGEPLTFDRTRYFVVGLSVVITALFAFAAMTTAAALMVGHLSWGFVGLGALWSAFIFNIDRWVVSSFDYDFDGKPGRAQRWGLTAVRLCIALLIAFSISEPLLMVIFRSEIQAALAEQRIRDVRAAGDEIRADSRYQMQDSPEARALADATAANASALARQRAANDAVDEELSGRGGSGVAGIGDRALEREADLRQADTEVTASAAALDVAQRAYTDKASRLADERDGAITARVREISDRAPGLIDRERALGALAQREFVVDFTQWLVRGLLFMIDLTPALLKMFSPQTLFERQQRMRARRLASEADRDVASAIQISAEKRELDSAAAVFELERWARVRDEEVARETDLALRKVIADHAHEVDERGYDPLASVGLLVAARRSNRTKSTDGEPDSTSGEPGGSTAGPRNETREDITLDDDGDDGGIAFDQPRRRNGAGRPGEGVTQLVGGRWRLGHPLVEPGAPVAWRTAFFAEDALDRRNRKKYFVVKRVYPVHGASGRPPVLNELHSLPIGLEISPFVAPVVQGGYDPDFGYFVVTPFYKNGTLAALMESEERHLTLHNALVYTEQILQGLETVFAERNRVHLDIKPSNIALDDRNIRIIDWGLATGLGIEDDAPIGYSLWYAPPEQVTATSGDKSWPSGRCDVRAVGATLYSLVTGAPPLFLEARNAGLLTERGGLKKHRQPEFERMLTLTQPATLDSFFAINEGWNREELQPLSDLVGRWLDPDPARRCPATEILSSAQSVALEDLRAVSAQLVGKKASSLLREVGGDRLVKHPLIPVDLPAQVPVPRSHHTVDTIVGEAAVGYKEAGI